MPNDNKSLDASGGSVSRRQKEKGKRKKKSRGRVNSDVGWLLGFRILAGWQHYMAHGEVSEIVPASSEVVFDLIHDYGRRLDWDTLLRAAYLEDGHAVAGKGVTSVCVGRRSLGGIAFKSVYVNFQRPTLAAVKMVNAPAFFKTWGASIHHEDISTHESRVTYKFHFTTKPRHLRFILDPLLGWVFAWETKKRLGALRTFLAHDRQTGPR